jgi:hypothetical protein
MKKFLRMAAVLVSIVAGACVAGGGPSGLPSVPSGAPGPVIGGTNPAAPPAPPAELPAALQISDPTIDVTTTLPASAALVGPGGTYSETMTAISLIADFTQDNLRGLLSPLFPVSIPVGSDVHNLTAVLTPNIVAKFSFADFGSMGCSGNTRDLPICVQVWLNANGEGYRPYMEAVFTSYPTAGNPGAANFMRGVRAGGGIAIGAAFDHTRPEDKYVESFYGFADLSDPENPVFPYNNHIYVRETIREDGKTLKTVQATDQEPDSCDPVLGEYRQGYGRWLEEEDVELFRLKSVENCVEEDTGDVCAQISTGNAANPPDSCELLDITNEGLFFIGSATTEDLILVDFDPLPPF